jgi:hypothetical protein
VPTPHSTSLPHHCCGLVVTQSLSRRPSGREPKSISTAAPFLRVSILSTSFCIVAGARTSAQRREGHTCASVRSVFLFSHFFSTGLHWTTLRHRRSLYMNVSLGTTGKLPSLVDLVRGFEKIPARKKGRRVLVWSDHLHHAPVYSHLLRQRRARCCATKERIRSLRILLPGMGRCRSQCQLFFSAWMIPCARMQVRLT